jgi:hypothetical protein
MKDAWEERQRQRERERERENERDTQSREQERERAESASARNQAKDENLGLQQRLQFTCVWIESERAGVESEKTQRERKKETEDLCR